MDKNITSTPTTIELKILSIYLGDISEGYHAREIARKLKISHRTVSLAMKNLEKKRVMNHKQAGKTRQYFLNFDDLLTKEYIKNAESIKFIQFIEKNFFIKKMLSNLSNILKTTPMLLFGSYAKGLETKASDIDILILKDTGEDRIIKKIKEISELYKKRVQIIQIKKEKFENLLKEKDHMVIEVVKNHIILNNVDFFMDIFWRYINEKRL